LIEKAFLGKLLERAPAFLRHVYTMFFVVLGWVIFVFDSTDGLTLGRGAGYIRAMFGAGGAGLINSADVWDIARSALLISVMIFASLPTARRAFWQVYEKKGRWVSLTSGALCVAALIICTAYLVDSSFNPFLYFRF
jgi:alginate O-acetyltransferase complex protein AlgI